jgi:hypothetical protein
LSKARARQQAAEAAADDHDVYFVGERLARETRRDVRIVDEMRESPDHLDVLVVALPAHPLVALLAILLAQRVGIEAKIRVSRFELRAHVVPPIDGADRHSRRAAIHVN